MRWDINTLSTWESLPDPREQRRFLEAHPELLGSSVVAQLGAEAAQLTKDAEHREIPTSSVHLLDEIRTRGSTIEATRDVYVDTFGGLVLDIPAWLQDIVTEYEHLHSSSSSEASDAAIPLLTHAVTRAGDDALDPAIMAELQSSLANAYLMTMPDGGLRAIEDALRAQYAALEVFTFVRFPHRWAHAQMTLGRVFALRVAGNQKENLDQAIYSFSNALEVFSHDGFPYESAACHYYLGQIYLERISGIRDENVERAIAHFEAALEVYTRESDLYHRARALTGLADTYVYAANTVGVDSRGPNLEQALAIYYEADQLVTPETSPEAWALLQAKMGAVYHQWPRGSRRDNLEQAIASYRLALQAITRDQYPDLYSSIQASLGSAFDGRQAGDARANHQAAVAAYEDALSTLPDGSPLPGPFTADITGLIRSAQSTEKSMQPIDHPQFTAFFPEKVATGPWNTLLVYAHIASGLAAVRADAAKFKSEMGSAERVERTTPGPEYEVKRGVEVTIVPTCKGVQFNPDHVSFTWMEDWHRSQFRFQASAELAGSACNGEVLVLIGPLVIATIKMAFLVSEDPSASHSNNASGLDTERSEYPFTHIFASYSHQDGLIVESCRKAYQALGLSVLIDFDSLRAGQTFGSGLMRLIDKADIFQLFWSARSASSSYVREEWEYAVQHTKGEGFIRPVYWELPMIPPPDELAALHFAFVPLMSILSSMLPSTPMPAETRVSPSSVSPSASELQTPSSSDATVAANRNRKWFGIFRSRG